MDKHKHKRLGRPRQKTISKAGYWKRNQHAIPTGPCEECGKAPADRHHKDGDPSNNARGNLQLLCRSCHTQHHNRSQRKLSKADVLRVFDLLEDGWSKTGIGRLFGVNESVIRSIVRGSAYRDWTKDVR